MASVAPPRHNFYPVPDWLNRILARAIVLKERSGLTRWMPFGVSLLCVGCR